MKTVADCLQAGIAELGRAGVPDARSQASSLLRYAIARDRAYIVSHPEYELTEHELAIFTDAVSRRSDRVPFQQIVGRQEFYGLDFIVTPDVLIPRPETEILVERAIEFIGDRERRFLDIGVGSGCISIAILKNCARATAIAVDVSDAALNVAKRNAEMHAVTERLDLRPSDVFAELADEKFDLIVSNPPYVPLADLETLQPEVRDHEPHLALTDNSNGLSIIEGIVAESPEHLKPGGWLLIEIGYGQRDQVASMFDRRRWAAARFIDDLQKIPRTLEAKLA